ncbi:MAG: hypothetical protein WC378_15065 [Opitutaceae bacterium]
MKSLRIVFLTFFGLACAGSLFATNPLKVLFLGNSQMFYYDLPKMVKILADSAPAERSRIEVGEGLLGGASLKILWDKEGPGSPRAMIATGKWDYVVIQEVYCPRQEEFETYAAKFDELIRNFQSRTVLFATASVSEFYQEGTTYPNGFVALNDRQLAFGKKHGILVALAGYAWMKYLGPNPSVAQRLDLYDKDKGHPGSKGTYLYACLLYAVLTGNNPEGLTNEFPSIHGGLVIPKAEAAKMQTAAWTQYLETKKASRD